MKGVDYDFIYIINVSISSYINRNIGSSNTSIRCIYSVLCRLDCIYNYYENTLLQKEGVGYRPEHDVKLLFYFFSHFIQGLEWKLK